MNHRRIGVPWIKKTKTDSWASRRFFGLLFCPFWSACAVGRPTALHLPIYILAQLNVFKAAFADHDLYVNRVRSYSTTFIKMLSKSYVFL